MNKTKGLPLAASKKQPHYKNKDRRCKYVREHVGEGPCERTNELTMICEDSICVS